MRIKFEGKIFSWVQLTHENITQCINYITKLSQIQSMVVCCKIFEGQSFGDIINNNNWWYFGECPILKEHVILQRFPSHAVSCARSATLKRSGHGWLLLCNHYLHFTLWHHYRPNRSNSLIWLKWSLKVKWSHNNTPLRSWVLQVQTHYWCRPCPVACTYTNPAYLLYLLNFEGKFDKKFRTKFTKILYHTVFHVSVCSATSYSN